MTRPKAQPRAARRKPSEVRVYLGTSLPTADAAKILPQAIYLPPIARGDLPRAVADGAKVVAIIDGVFEQSLAVTPFEVRDALRAGVKVFGASSMGALRAAETYPLGMIGVGTIYEWYKSGFVDADDEVALRFDAETYRNHSVPLVNIRHALTSAHGAGRISQALGDALLSDAIALPYESRSYKLLLRRVDSKLLPEGDAAALVAYLEGFDLKRDDAVRCLEVVRATLP